MNGNRIGLALSGDLHAAVRVLAPGSEGPEALRAAVDELDELRDLIAFAGSKSYAQARRSLGFHVQDRASASTASEPPEPSA